MSVDITKILWRKQLAPVSTKFVFMCLCSHAKATGQDAKPSVSTIAAETGLSEAQVYRALKDLKDRKLLLVSRRASRRYRLCVNYAINLEALGSLPEVVREPWAGPLDDSVIDAEATAADSHDENFNEDQILAMRKNDESTLMVRKDDSHGETLTTSVNHQEEGTTLPSLRSGNAHATTGRDLDPEKPSQRQQLEAIGVKVAAVIPDDVPVAAMVASYHQRVPSGSKLIKITAPRVAALRRVWRDIGRTPEAWKAFLDRVEASDWLTGRRTDRDGGAFSALDLDWITGAKNFEKITGGRYDNRDGNRHNSARSVAGKTAKELWPNLV